MDKETTGNSPQIDIDWDALEKAAAGQEEQNEQPQDQSPTSAVPPGIDPEVYELAVALKKLREDPQVAALASQLQAGQQPVQAATAPGMPGVQQQPEIDPEAKRLEEVNQKIAELRQRYMQVEPSSEEANRIAMELAELQNEKLVLEPKVAVKQQLAPIRQAQAALQVTTLLQQVAMRLNSDPRLAKLTPEQKQYVYAVVQDALTKLSQQAPDQLLGPVGPSLVEAAIRSAVYDVVLPSAPYDPGHGMQQNANPMDQIPREILEAAKEDGVPLKTLVENLKEAMNG